ncbi:MAG TPA: MEDS domain-containing protein [Candidatus Limnocylindria bacterium]|nr:MEDS domain-containing protein [Candidatus Limnocylindria bacterium]
MVLSGRSIEADRSSDGDHAVQFYAYESQLIDRVSRFLATGLLTGGPAVAIATLRHRRSIEAALAERGVDVRGAVRGGRLQLLDAAGTLARFMSDGRPNAERFQEVIGAVLDAAGEGARAYGEMVALLWLAGKPDAALELERMWNDLAERRSFALLCGYPTELFQGSTGVSRIVELANVHDRIAPPNVGPDAA